MQKSVLPVLCMLISQAFGQINFELKLQSFEQSDRFTFELALLEGLKSGNADVNKDQQTTVSELRNYVGKRVQELTKGKQSNQ